MDHTPGNPSTVVVYTLGHSSLPIDSFLEILRRHRIEVVVDVRSDPFSRHVPHFNKRDLEGAVTHAGFTYRYAGGVLGGKPKDAGLYGPKGVPDYDRIAALPGFQRALTHLRELAAAQRVVVVCSEADAMQCHREKLLARELRAQGVEVRHIRSDGTLADPPAQGVLL